MSAINSSNWKLQVDNASVKTFNPDGSEADVIYILDNDLAEKSSPDLIQRVQSLSNKASPHFEVRTIQGRSVVIIKPEASSMGRLLTCLGSAAVALGGLALSYRNPKTSSVVVAGSIQTFLAAYNQENEDFCATNCLKKGIVGSLTNLATSSVSSKLSPAISERISNPLVSHLVTQGALSTIGTVVDQAANRTFDPVEIVFSGLSSSVGSLAGLGVSKAIGNVAGEAAKMMGKAAAEGAARSGASKMADNLLHGQSLSDNIVSSAVTGLALSSVTELPKAIEASLKIPVCLPPPPDYSSLVLKEREIEEWNNSLKKKEEAISKNNNLSETDLSKKASELEELNKSLSKQEKIYSDQYNAVKNRIQLYLDYGYKECAKWARGNVDATVGRIMNGEKIHLRKGDSTHSERQTAMKNPAEDRAKYNEAKSKLDLDRETLSKQQALKAEKEKFAKAKEKFESDKLIAQTEMNRYNNLVNSILNQEAKQKLILPQAVQNFNPAEQPPGVIPVLPVDDTLYYILPAIPSPTTHIEPISLRMNFQFETEVKEERVLRELPVVVVENSDDRISEKEALIESLEEQKDSSPTGKAGRRKRVSLSDQIEIQRKLLNELELKV